MNGHSNCVAARLPPSTDPNLNANFNGNGGGGDGGGCSGARRHQDIAAQCNWGAARPASASAFAIGFRLHVTRERAHFNVRAAQAGPIVLGRRRLDAGAI